MRKHKRYIGNFLTSYVSICVVVLIIFPIVFALITLLSAVNGATIFLSFMCLASSILWLCNLLKTHRELFAWCTFCECSVKIKMLFEKSFELEYDKCVDIGVGYYIHSTLNSSLGNKVLYIYLSYDKLQEKYKKHINLLRVTDRCVKIGYKKETLDFLMNKLPKQQLEILKNSISQSGRTGDG